jgi:WD40 repeat protein
MASASYDRTVQIWEAATGRPVYSFDGHKYPVYTVAWSSNGQYIASGDAGFHDNTGATHDTGATVKVWPVNLFEGNSQQPKPTVVSYPQNNISNVQSNAVQAVAWSPDNRYIASVAHDVQIFDSFTAKHIYTYTKHSGGSSGSAVQAVVWSPNGKYIASGGMEGTVQVWNARL